MSAPKQTAPERAVGRFHTELRSTLDTDTAAWLFPSALADAAQRSFAAAGAGLSVFAEHRVPIGSSGLAATTAERLQFTVGEGPCLAAVANGRAVRVDEDQMAREWPAFYDSIRRETPFRSIIAVPFELESGLHAAMDVYFDAAEMPPYSMLADATAVAQCIGELLDQADTSEFPPSDNSEDDLPDWALGPQARRRLRAWIAVGIVVAGLELTPDDALARLRAAAYARGEDLDQLADDMTGGSVRPQDLDA